MVKINTTGNIFLRLLIIGLSLLLSCFNVSDRKGRMNPFDPNGGNWFPPTINIIEDTITGSIHDTILIKTEVFDQNGTVNFLSWTSVPSILEKTDTITFFNDSIVLYDTITEIITIPHDTILFDTTTYDSTFNFTYKIEIHDSTLIITVRDSLPNDSLYNDTLRFDSTSDSTYFFDVRDSTYFIYLSRRYDSTFTIATPKDTIFIDSIYYIYASQFRFDTSGTFTLFSSAIDDDGVTSLIADSIVVIISDTASMEIFSMPRKRSSIHKCRKNTQFYN